MRLQNLLLCQALASACFTAFAAEPAPTVPHMGKFNCASGTVRLQFKQVPHTMECKGQWSLELQSLEGVKAVLERGMSEGEVQDILAEKGFRSQRESDTAMSVGRFLLQFTGRSLVEVAAVR